jgi:hypothetical protein
MLEPNVIVYLLSRTISSLIFNFAPNILAEILTSIILYLEDTIYYFTNLK